MGVGGRGTNVGVPGGDGMAGGDGGGVDGGGEDGGGGKDDEDEGVVNADNGEANGGVRAAGEDSNEAGVQGESEGNGIGETKLSLQSAGDRKLLGVEKELVEIELVDMSATTVS